MEMNIQKQIIDFFSFFEEFHNVSKTCLKDCQKCAVTINKLINRCKNIRDAEVTQTPLDEFDGLQGKLCAALHNIISEEIHELKRNLGTIEDLFDKLCNKHKVFRQSCEELDYTEQSKLIKGSPLQPPLQQLLEFADDALTFGSQVCAQIETSISVLTFKGLKSDSLVDNFKVSSEWGRRIPEIIAYTSFCTENQV